MSQPPPSPQASTASPSAPSDAAERTQSDNPSPPSAAPSSSEESAPAHRCQWISCDKVLPDPEALYNHLCNDHIGRKSTGNLCLTCKWKDCGTTCAKRDHITSHLRVHTPLKPHVCEICKKPFKRPQDLKKHEKIHTEEHHAQHKHSKAITVSDPAYSSRVRGENDKPRTLIPPPHHHIPVARAKSSSVPLSDSSSGPDFGLLPTPSPELDYAPEATVAHGRSQMYRVQPQVPTWEVLADDLPNRSVPVSGSKRAFEYTVDDFFTDMKKRRVTPAYDPHMAARLSNLAYQQSLSATTNAAPPPGNPPPTHSFPPRSVSFDIRTPEELAAVNEFLITLGRDVSGAGAHLARHQHSQSVPHASVDEAAFFDPANLAQLGLAGMPGVPSAPGPGSGAGYHGESGYVPLNEFSHHGTQYPSRASQQPIQSVQFGLYPSVQDITGAAAPLPYTANRVRAQRASATDERLLSLNHSPQFPEQNYHVQGYSHYLTPPLDLGSAANPGASPLSSHSGMSTPPSATPPHIPLTVAPESAAAFDFVRSGRAPPPVVQLASVDYSTKSMRQVVPLKSAGPPASLASRPEPMEPKLGRGAPHIGLPARLTASAASSVASSASAGKSNPLYPLLTSGDEQFKLPPLSARFRSPSPAISSSTSSSSSSSSESSREPTVSPTLSYQALGANSPSPTSTESVTPNAPPSYPTPPSSSSQERVAYPMLPSLSSLASYASKSASRERSEELAREVGQIELESSSQVRAARGAITPEERKKHALLLRDLLVAINMEYRRMHGTPSPNTTSSQAQEVHGVEREVRDVEMIAV
ncbi:hypothetical protein L227DRAFT_571576 [Lentinus tigrinus ALCF2SS1-6]|uniref:C2H2-type domain-containing protein n=1 Tax=Lentinus tigrinus ALCF2SS1-6 TaxID=1328759 RepID=A0A5C2SMS9_9APHY|nr:hypothetical protein L227DRAFT_571576 [Lentinus tigrinus ALCF2SS1-6]